MNDTHVYPPSVIDSANSQATDQGKPLPGARRVKRKDKSSPVQVGTRKFADGTRHLVMSNGMHINPDRFRGSKKERLALR